MSSGVEGGRTFSRVALGDAMRAVRLVIAVLIVSPILMLALSESRLSRQPFAQVTAAPGPVLLTAPVAPGQPQSFATIGALPALAAAPGTLPAAVASAVATKPRAFRCTCSAPGTGTEWAGLVSSSSYFLAGQSARAQCATYLSSYNPGSAYMVPEGSAVLGKPTAYNGTAFTQRAQVSTTASGIRPSLQQAEQRAIGCTTNCICTQCACN